VILRRGHVEAMLRLHARVLAEGGSAEEAMWVVLSSDRMARMPGARVRARPSHDIVGAVVEQMGIGARKLMSSPRCRERWVAFQLLRDDGWTVRAIAQLFGVAPGTVLYGLDKLGDYDPLVGALYELRIKFFNREGSHEREIPAV
jgi:hypothetical protein